MDDIWVTVAGESSIERVILTVHGRVSRDSAVARVTLSDGEVIDIEVQTDGYFIDLVTRPDIDLSTPNHDHIPEATHVAALDAEGQIIGENDLP